MPLLLGYAGEIGTPDRTFACNLRVRSAALYTLSYGSVEKWCAGAVLPRLPPQCRCGDLLVIYRRVMLRDAAMSGGPGWIRTINLPIQSRALHWLSYRARNGADYRCCPGLISFTGRVHGCSAKPA